MWILDKYNAFVGAAIAVLSAVFGQFWYLFGAFLLFNALDWLTGWAKARKLHVEDSKVGFRGAVKKLGYWVIVLMAFVIPLAFIQLGAQIGVNLSFLEMLGWFTLASLMVNEARSVLENLVEMEYPVPPILIKGLAVTDKLINKKADAAAPDDNG